MTFGKRTSVRVNMHEHHAYINYMVFNMSMESQSKTVKRAYPDMEDEGKNSNLNS